MTRPFTAKFSGRCAADCGDPIRPGDDVQYLADELFHTECSGHHPAPPPRPRPEPAPCGACHLVHAGDCW